MRKSYLHIVFGVGLAVALCVFSARAATDESTREEKQYSGTITAIEPAARTVTVKKALVSHTFTLPEGATIVTAGKTVSTIGDLRTGEEVDVFYREHGDMKDAYRIVQRGAETGAANVKRETPKRESGTYDTNKPEKQYSGTVESIDPQARTFTVRQALITHTFQLASPAKIDIRGKTISTLGDLRTGDQVDVYYTDPDGTMIAHRVAVKENK
jgi:hypothetical protein